MIWMGFWNHGVFSREPEPPPEADSGARGGLALERVIRRVIGAAGGLGDRWGPWHEEGAQQEHRIGKIEAAVIVAVCGIGTAREG